MKPRTIGLVYLAFWWSCMSAPAREPLPVGNASATWTVDDVLLAESMGEVEIAPDGRWLVWTKRTMDKDKGEAVTQLLRSSLTEKQDVEMTRGPESTRSPRWSPDGKLLAFITARPNPGGKPPAKGPKPQIWLMNPFGGEPWPISDVERGVSTLEWVDSDTILFAAAEAPTLHEHTRTEEKKDTSVVVDDETHEPPVRLFKLNVKNKKVQRLTINVDRIRGLSVSPDGKFAVTIHDRSLSYVYDSRVKPLVFLNDLTSNSQTAFFTDPLLNVRQVHWARDSKGFYALSAYSGHPQQVQATITQLYHYDLASKATSQVDLGWERGLAFGLGGSSLSVTNDGFVALLANGARRQAARYYREGTGWRHEWLTGQPMPNVFSLDVARNGRTLVYAHTTASTPVQWYRARLEKAQIADPVPLTDLNAGWKSKPIARTEVVRWKGALDEEVEGVLWYPHRYQPGKKYPLIVAIHGGPAGADYDAWEDSWGYPCNLLCQRGAFVFKPNYHGSSDYGLRWVQSIAGGKYYDLEVPDIEKGVDALIARQLVDPEKLGVMGWSNGGILTIALTVASTRYKAASAGAGDVDWSSDWGNCEFGASFDNYYLGKSPLEDPMLYVRKSPFYRLDRVRTPTIIFFGTEDRAVPTQQGWMHYRALQQLGKTDVRFILFPGEPHGPRKLVHQRRKVEEELAWFDRYLFQTAKPENEALKPDSLLALAIKSRGFQRDGQRYGVLVKDILIPETVAFQGLEVGRFEVTRAQYAHYDKSYGVDAGKENFPANHLRFEQAQAYCAWLSGVTGQVYRLPTEEEAAKLYDQAGPRENTLDHWAGYSLNPDDAARLQPTLKELGANAPLLKEVGSFSALSATDLIFDLGGNVAEWITAKDGTGQIRGGSADTPADRLTKPHRPAAEYVGFRVVRVPTKTAGR